MKLAVMVCAVTAGLVDGNFPGCSQPSLEKASCTRKHTLTYTKGYANEAPMGLVGEPRGSLSPDLIAAQTYGSPKAQSGGASTMPKWITNDRKVRPATRTC
jgi:hypothetical protein